MIKETFFPRLLKISSLNSRLFSNVICVTLFYLYYYCKHINFEFNISFLVPKKLVTYEPQSQQRLFCSTLVLVIHCNRSHLLQQKFAPFFGELHKKVFKFFYKTIKNNYILNSHLVLYQQNIFLPRYRNLYIPLDLIVTTNTK